MTNMKINTSKILQNSSIAGTIIRSIIVKIVEIPQIYIVSSSCSSFAGKEVMEIAWTINVKTANSKKTTSFAGSLFIKISNTMSVMLVIKMVKNRIDNILIIPPIVVTRKASVIFHKLAYYYLLERK